MCSNAGPYSILGTMDTINRMIWLASSTAESILFVNFPPNTMSVMPSHHDADLIMLPGADIDPEFLNDISLKWAFFLTDRIMRRLRGRPPLRVAWCLSIDIDMDASENIDTALIFDIIRIGFCHLFFEDVRGLVFYSPGKISFFLHPVTLRGEWFDDRNKLFAIIQLFEMIFSLHSVDITAIHKMWLNIMEDICVPTKIISNH